MSENSKVEVAILANTNEANAALVLLTQHFGSFQKAVEQLARQANQSFDGMRQSAFRLAAISDAFQPALSLLGKIGAQIQDVAGVSSAWAEKVTALSRTLGISTEKAERFFGFFASSKRYSI